MAVVLFTLPVIGDVSLGMVLSIGGTILQFLLAPKPKDPTFKSMTSAWGETIPIVFNYGRMPGKVIQAGEIKKHSNKSKKGGPTFSQTVAFAFCEGERNIGRIWADNQVIYDPRPIIAPSGWAANTLYGAGDYILSPDGHWLLTASLNGQTGSSIPSFDLRVDATTRDGDQVWVASKYKARTKVGNQFNFTMRQYLGSETQLPDSALEELVGTGRQPGYRGIVYIVLEDFNLTKFGNRIPNIEAEILPPAPFPYAFSPSTIDSAFRQMWSDPDGQYAYFWGSATGPDANQIIKLNLVNGSVAQVGPVQADGYFGDAAFGPPVSYATGGTLYSLCFDSGDGNNYLVSYDPVTLDHVTRLVLDPAAGPALPIIPSPDGQFVVGMQYDGFGSGETQKLWMINTSSGLQALYNLADYGFPADPYDANNFVYYTPTFDKGDGSTFGLWWYDENGNFWKVSTSCGAVTTPVIVLASTHTYNARTNDGATYGGIVYNPDTDMMYAISEKASPDSFDSWVVPINTLTNVVGTPMTLIGGSNSQYNLGDVWGWHRGRYLACYKPYTSGNPSEIGRFDTLSGTTTYYSPVSYWTDYPAGYVEFFSAAINFDGTGITALNIDPSDTPPNADDAFFFPLNPSTFTLGDICRDISGTTGQSGRIGLLSTDVDFSGLDSVIPRGAWLTARDSARSFLESMQPAFFYDLVDVGEKVVGTLRSNDAVVVEVPEDDLAATDSISNITDKITNQRNDDREIPQDLSIQYYDIDHDYQAGSQQDRRATVTQYSSGRNTVSVPVVMNAGEANNAAHRGLYLTWVERTPRKFSLPPEYLGLTSADVITLVKGGQRYEVRITKASLQKNWSIDFESVSEDLGTYSRQVPAPLTGVAVGSFTPGTVDPVAPLELAVMDTSVLRIDDVQLPGVYVATGPNVVDGNFDNAAVQNSPDDSNWTTQVTLNFPAVIGTTVDALGTPADWTVFDDASSVTVTPFQGTLANASRDDLTASGTVNAIWFENGEIIQFTTVLDNGDGTYTLSGFFRGRFGTESFISSHDPGEQFVLLNATDGSMNTVNYSNSDIGAERWWQAINDAPDDPISNVEDLTMTTRRLMPRAPYFIRGSRDGSGNLTITGKRRMRWHGRALWVPPETDTPVTMQIDILDGSTVKRTITSTVSGGGSSVTDASAFSAYYSLADQVTDFGSAQSSISLKAYQINALVGRGYPGSKTV